MARARVPNALYRAFDEAQFGDARTLNLRDGLPSGIEAAARAEAWLRLKQVEGAREVLIITGRGTNSIGAVPVIRAHVAQRLTKLRRAGVVSSVREHTAGSYVVRLSPMSEMLSAVDRAPRSPAPSAANVAGLSGLTTDTRRLVQELAVRTLASLGIQATRAMITDEMERQTALLTSAMPRDANREYWIRSAALRVLNDAE